MHFCGKGRLLGKLLSKFGLGKILGGVSKLHVTLRVGQLTSVPGAEAPPPLKLKHALFTVLYNFGFEILLPTTELHSEWYNPPNISALCAGEYFSSTSFTVF